MNKGKRELSSGKEVGDWEELNIRFDLKWGRRDLEELNVSGNEVGELNIR